MTMREHLKPLGLIFSLMIAVTLVTTMVALRLRPVVPAAPVAVISLPGEVAIVPTSAISPTAAVIGPTGSAAVAPAGAPTESGAVQAAAPAPMAGQCRTDAVSLIESAVPADTIAGGLGDVHLPTATPYGR